MTVVDPTILSVGRRTRPWRPVVAAAATGVVVLWTSSYPDLPFNWALLSVAGGVVTVALAVARTGLVAGQPSRRSTAVGASIGAAALLASALTVAMLPTRPALHARFNASLSAYTEAVAQAGEPDLTPLAANAAEEGTVWGDFRGPCPARIGLFWVAQCRTFPAGYLFLQPENSVGDDSGIAYVPQGIPADGERSGVYRSEFTHVQGPWYVWSCGC